MVAIIGGNTSRFKPLIDLYRETGAKFGHAPQQLTVGVHSLGYVASTKKQAADEFFPGYARAMASVAKERGWGSINREHFDNQLGADSALLIGEAEEVAEKILRHSEALGGVSRFTFQMNASSLPHAKLMKAIEALGERVAPLVRAGTHAVQQR
jgi:alkanesulfonate monooxygenase SsuD/methylene tetrahydromethanopterin reductase-like flavin-dependent oxidoreductase (luciferase family)